MKIRQLLCLVVATCLAPSTAWANPVGGTVVAGSANIDNRGNILTITNTPGTVINWNGFSIGAGEITRFIQRDGSSAVLNRIVGQDPSRIFGALQSNGRVFLINPNGIVFGAGPRGDVNGLVPSPPNITNDDFRSRRLPFHAGSST